MGKLLLIAAVFAGFVMFGRRTGLKGSTTYKGLEIELDRSEAGWNWTAWDNSRTPPAVVWSGGPFATEAAATINAQNWIDANRGPQGATGVAPYLTMRAGNVMVQAFAEAAGVRVVTTKGGTVTQRTAENVLTGNAWAIADMNKAAGADRPIDGTLVRAIVPTVTFRVTKEPVPGHPMLSRWVYTTSDGVEGSGTTREAATRNALRDAQQLGAAA